jgi:hypothetical protein
MASNLPDALFATGPAPLSTNSCIEGVAGGPPCCETGTCGPIFTDADGADDIRGTLDDDLSLADGSACIDAGDNAAVPVGNETDYAGNPRFVDDPTVTDSGQGTPPIVDIGALEHGP